MRTKSNASKWRIGLFASFLLLSVAIVPAQAQTLSADQILQALRNNPALLQQLSALLGQTVTPVSPTVFNFNRNLTIGSRGADVSALQAFLMNRGFTIPAGATGYFGAQTRSALVRYQASVALPATGFFGPLTRANIASLATPGTGTGTGGPVITPPSGLSGGEGQLVNVEETSAEVEREVREGAEEAVLGAEMEAEDSDIALERVEVQFDAPADGSNRLNRYVDSVSLTLDDEEIATLDVERGSRSGDTTTFRFSGLNNAIIREGDTGILRVVVQAVENVDTDDEDQSWIAVIPSNGIRAVDAAGFSDTYPGSDIESEFSVVSLSSFGLELQVGEGDEDINDAHTVSVSSSATTRNVDILSFTLDAEASDILVNDIPVRLTATGATLNEIIDRVSLYSGSTLLDDVSIPSGASTTVVTFTDLDLDISEGDSETLTVRVDVRRLAGNFTAGDAIRAEITSTQTDAIDAEDENGDSLDEQDLTGTATGEDVSFFEEGVNVSFVRQSATEQDREAGLSDEGRYEIVFRVTAFGDDIYVIDNTTEDNDGTYATGSGVVYSITTPDGNDTRATLSSTASRSGDTFQVREGSSEEFTLTVFATAAGAGGTARVSLEAIEWSTTAGATSGTIQTSGIDERFQTGTLDLTAR